MSDHQAVLFANEAFYHAFADRDFGAMTALWSDSAPLTCIHPGWGMLDGREDIFESWSAIISNPESPNIECWKNYCLANGQKEQSRGVQSNARLSCGNAISSINTRNMITANGKAPANMS